MPEFKIDPATVAAMPKDEAEDVRATIENEGFHYAFAHYSDFGRIKDERFHVLRRAYLDAAKALNDYVGVDS